jgi:hypothetical protein
MTGEHGESHTVTVPKGYRVGPWEVREPLASGAFATVYAAHNAAGDDGLPARAALKFLPTGTRTPRQLSHLRDLAEREVALLRRLRAPRLIRMYAALTVDDPDRPELDGATVIVLERAERALQDSLDRVPRPGVLLTQICEGLCQLHDAGWIHGDLKPANVLLMRDGSVRLADFALAAELEGTHAYAPAFATPDYTPPELLWSEIGERGTVVRPSADIWAFGVLAHVVLTGSFPFPGATTEARTDAAARYARGTEELRLPDDLPDEWAQIVRACLAREHTGRMDAGTLLRRVREAAAGARRKRPARARGPGFRRGHPVLAGCLAAVLLATSGLAVASFAAHRWATRPDGTPVYEALPSASAAPTGPAGEVVWGYHRCAEDRVCFFSEHNGNGQMCSWRESDPDWGTGAETCPWAAHSPVRSVFNNIADDRGFLGVVYYRGADFAPRGHDRRRAAQRAGCSNINSMGNLAGTYAPRSHRLVKSCSFSPSVWGLLSSLW